MKSLVILAIVFCPVFAFSKQVSIKRAMEIKAWQEKEEAKIRKEHQALIKANKAFHIDQHKMREALSVEYAQPFSHLKKAGR